jgi:predicted nicotinamide N-methyase
MTPRSAEALVRAFTRPEPAGLVPEVRLHLAQEIVPLWQATEELAGHALPPPFWAFAWPGSQVLARYLLDRRGLVDGRRVLDYGSGAGLAAIAAVLSGAASVVANDVDRLAAVAQRLNAELNGVTFERACHDLVGQALDVDVVLAGDVCYEQQASERLTPWLRSLADTGVLVLLADPGRHYAPSDGLELLETFEVPTLHELESVDHKRTRLWRVLPERR